MLQTRCKHSQIVSSAFEERVSVSFGTLRLHGKSVITPPFVGLAFWAASWLNPYP